MGVIEIAGIRSIYPLSSGLPRLIQERRRNGYEGRRIPGSVEIGGEVLNRSQVTTLRKLLQTVERTGRLPRPKKSKGA